jgi:hypothetical protein
MRLEGVGQRGQFDRGHGPRAKERIALGKGARGLGRRRLEDAEVARRAAGLVGDGRADQHLHPPLAAGGDPGAVRGPHGIARGVLARVVAADRRDEHRRYPAFSSTTIPAPVIEAGA